MWEKEQDFSFFYFLFYFFTFSPSFSTSNQGCSVRASPFSTLLIFNSSCFALPLSYLMGGEEVQGILPGHRGVFVLQASVPTRHLSPRQPHGADRKWRDAELIGQEATLAAATHIKSVREAAGLLSAWHRASVWGGWVRARPPPASGRRRPRRGASVFALKAKAADLHPTSTTSADSSPPT